MEVGMIFETKKSGKCEVISYDGCTNITVQFEDGYVKICSANALRNGNVKSPFYPSVQGMGFLGEGPYITSKNKILTQESITWRGMLQRCYDNKFLLKHPSYKDNFVSQEFLNFQNFAHWCQSAIGFNNTGWCLDKDIIFKGNKIYSERTCCFIPHEINNLFINSKVCRGQYPVGVSFNKNTGRYSASCHKNGKQITVGEYETPEQAFIAYKIFKEIVIKEVAEKWKDQIDIRVYDSLMLWSIDVED